MPNGLYWGGNYFCGLICFGFYRRFPIMYIVAAPLDLFLVMMLGSFCRWTTFVIIPSGSGATLYLFIYISDTFKDIIT